MYDFAARQKIEPLFRSQWRALEPQCVASEKLEGALQVGFEGRGRDLGLRLRNHTQQISGMDDAGGRCRGGGGGGMAPAAPRGGGPRGQKKRPHKKTRQSVLPP